MGTQDKGDGTGFQRGRREIPHAGRSRDFLTEDRPIPKCATTGIFELVEEELWCIMFLG